MKALLSSCSRLLGLEKKAAAPKGIPNPEHLNLQQLPILSASELIQACGYAPDLPELFRLVGVQEQHFDNLYLSSLYAFAEAVQLAPASESHHHAGPGGLLKHTLEVVHNALQLRKAYQLPRRGEPETIVAQEHAWTFGVFAGALLHDAGKVMSRSPLLISLSDGTERPWNPHDRQLMDIAPVSYRIAFKDAPYRAHNRYALTLFSVILPSIARGWLTNYPHILSQLVAYLWGDEFESGDIGEIVVKADRASTAANLGGNPDTLKFPDAKVSTAEQLVSGLRQLLGEQDIKLNQNGGMGWIHNDFAYFVCKPLAEKLQGYLASQGVTGIPSDTTRIYDILQEGGFALSTAEDQAIWNITVQGDGYQHNFTCLKFEARRLFSHNRSLPSFNGLVMEGAAPTAAPATTIPIPEVAPVPATQPATVPVSPVAAPTPIHRETTPSPRPAVTDTAPRKESVPVSPLAAIQAKHIQESVPASSNHAVATGSLPQKNETVSAQEANNNVAQSSVPTGMPASPVIMGRAAPEPALERPRNVGQPITTEAVAEDQLSTPAPSSAQMTDDTGKIFLGWIKSGIHDKALQVNNGKAPIHFVEEGVLLISPVIFKVFCKQHGLHGENDYNKLQKRLIRMNKHIKGKLTNKNILNYIGKKAGGGEFKLNGLLLPYNLVFASETERPEINRFLSASEKN